MSTYNSRSVRGRDQLLREKDIVDSIGSHIAEYDGWDSSVDGERQLLAGVSQLSSDIVCLSWCEQPQS